MAEHILEPQPTTLHGHYSRDLKPVLNINSGDRVICKLLDARWHVFDGAAPFEAPANYEPRDRERDPHHAMHGPIFINGAKPGMTLELHFQEIIPATWGWSGAGYMAWSESIYGLDEQAMYYWQLDKETNRATHKDGYQLAMRPFLGNVGMPPNEEGRHSTHPPRWCGGNIDCKELVAGSRLFLPVPVEGGLLSLGDGHAMQGDGEVAGPALECPMERVVVDIHLHDDMPLTMPRAHTPAGWITFGFDEDLNRAQEQALNGMLDLITAQYGVPRVLAMSFASLKADLRVTQIVNGVKGVHMILPHDAIHLPDNT